MKSQVLPPEGGSHERRPKGGSHDRGRWAHGAFSLALLAYPRAFRRRFGREMRRDFDGTWRTLVTVACSGLGERATAVHRWLFWPTHRDHLYEPVGRHFMFWDTVRADFRHACRLAAKAPLVTTLTILALALGIGANTAIFAVVNSVLLKRLPYRDSDRLVMVWSNATKQDRPRNTVSPANFLDFQKMNRTFDQVEAYFSFVTPAELAIDGPSEVTIGVFVTPRMFDLLGRQPIIGRTFGPDGSPLEIVLNHGFWQRRFGGDPNIVGRKVVIANNPATIVGVMPPDFTFPYGTMFGPSGFTRTTSVDLWVPIAFTGPGASANRMLTPQGQIVRGTHWLGAVGRMKPGVTLEQVQADMSTVARQLEQSYPDTNTGWGATVVPILEQTVGTVRTPFLLLLAGVGFVLLMATVNVANLVLARSISRQKELATRLALGAGRARVVQQALIEGLVVGALGGVAGLVLGVWGVSALVAQAPADLPRLSEVGLDGRLLAFTAGITTVTGILVGVLPAVSATTVTPHAALQEHTRGAVGGTFRQRARAALVVTEVALAVTLTIGAGLLLRSFVSLLNVDTGFDAEQLLTWQMNIPDRLPSQDERTAFYAEFMSRMKSLPGIVSVGGTTRLPLGSTGLTTRLDIDGRPRPNAEWPEVQFRRAIGDYFQTMGIPLLRGRFFTDADRLPAPPVAIVNQTLAAKLFPNEDAVGKRVRFSTTQPWSTIVGVVGDIKHGALDEIPEPEMYVSHLQGQVLSPYIVLRTTGHAADAIDVVRREALKLDRDLPIYRLQTMDGVKADSVAQRRFVLMLAGLFGLLALSLAGIGVYGVMALLVSERTREVGVRLALGAQPVQVMTMLVGQAMRLAGLGVAIGVAAAVALMPYVESQLYAVTPRDPATLLAIPLVLIAIAALAAIVPARRAMSVNPVQALRYE